MCFTLYKLTLFLNFIPVKSSQVESSAASNSAENVLANWMSKDKQSERSPDFVAFRNQLWRAMSLFPEKCEPKSRDIVPLFLSFLQ
jgi:hypothetical protein